MIHALLLTDLSRVYLRGRVILDIQHLISVNHLWKPDNTLNHVCKKTPVWPAGYKSVQRT